MPENHSYKTIPLTQGQFAIVDAGDYERVSAWKWSATRPHNVWYAVKGFNRDGKQTTLSLHAFLMNDPPDYRTPRGFQIDHKNRNGLDCRRENMRIVTYPQNGFNRPADCDNRSGFKGIHRAGHLWYAALTIGNKRHRAKGGFKTAEDAARAYDKLAMIHHGEFAYLNFPAAA